MLAPRALPADSGFAVDLCRRARSAADAILPFRPSGRNEPYALLLASPAWSLVVAGDPLNRVQVAASRGFTLVEILVALAILAVALAAGMRAVAQSADGATLLKQRTLALWVAQNRLAVAQLASPWPAPGLRDGEAVQAGARFVWRETVSGTPNPDVSPRSRSSSPTRCSPTTRSPGWRATSDSPAQP